MQEFNVQSKNWQIAS